MPHLHQARYQRKLLLLTGYDKIIVSSHNLHSYYIERVWNGPQVCFKEFWKEHKSIHKKAGELKGWLSRASIISWFLACSVPKVWTPPSSYNPWPGYQFTGRLRPYPVVRERRKRGSEDSLRLMVEERECLFLMCICRSVCVEVDIWPYKGHGHGVMLVMMWYWCGMHGW